MTITLAAAGHTVVAGMRGTTGKNAAVARELAALPNVDVVELDVTSDESVQQAVAQTLTKYARPLRYPLDAVAEGTDVEFINARAAIKARWLEKYTA
jgi:NAD(P)-dependent dehydrogenase (short-subunit alcohol dehydrogenase family)